MTDRQSSSGNRTTADGGAGAEMNTTSHRAAVCQEIREIFHVSTSGSSGSGDPNVHFDKNALLIFQEKMKRSVAIAEKYHFPAKYFFNCSRADILAANVKALEEMAMEKLSQLEQHDHLEESQKKITKVVRLLLPLATHPQVKRPLMLALAKLKHVNPGFLNTIASNPELYQQSPVNVIRQLWLEDEEIQQQELRDCIQAYHLEWATNLQESLVSNTAILHTSTRLRRATCRPLLRVAFVIGNSRKLYQQSMASLRKRCRTTTHPFLSALRVDLFMCVKELHRKQQGFLSSSLNAAAASDTFTGTLPAADALASSTTGASSSGVTASGAATSSLSSSVTGWLALVDSLVMTEKSAGGGSSAALAHLRPEKDPSETDALSPVIWLLDYSVNRTAVSAQAGGGLTRAQTQKLCLVTRDIIQAKESHAWELSRVYCDCHVHYLIVSTLIRAVFRIRKSTHLPRNSNRVKFLVEVLMMSLRHTLSTESSTSLNTSGEDTERHSLSEKMEAWQKVITCVYLPLLLQFHIACRRLARKEKLLKLKKNRSMAEERMLVALPVGLLSHQMSSILLQYVLLVSIEDENWIAVRSVLHAIMKNSSSSSTSAVPADTSETCSLLTWRIDCLQSVVALLTSMADDRRRTSLLSLLHEVLVLAMPSFTTEHVAVSEDAFAVHGTGEGSSSRPLQVTLEQIVVLYARVVLALPRAAFLEERRQCVQRLIAVKTRWTASLDDGEELPSGLSWCLQRLETFLAKLQVEIAQQEELAQAFSPPPKTSIPNFAGLMTPRVGGATVRPVGPQFTPMITPLMETGESELEGPHFAAPTSFISSASGSSSIASVGMESPPKYSPVS